MFVPLERGKNNLKTRLFHYSTFLFFLFLSLNVFTEQAMDFFLFPFPPLHPLLLLLLYIHFLILLFLLIWFISKSIDSLGCKPWLLPLTDQIPTGELAPVAGTFFDFSSKARPLGDAIDGIGGDPPGLDHCLVTVGASCDGKAEVNGS